MVGSSGYVTRFDRNSSPLSQRIFADIFGSLCESKVTLIAEPLSTCTQAPQIFLFRHSPYPLLIHLPIFSEEKKI